MEAADLLISRCCSLWSRSSCTKAATGLDELADEAVAATKRNNSDVTIWLIVKALDMKWVEMAHPGINSPFIDKTVSVHCDLDYNVASVVSPQGARL